MKNVQANSFKGVADMNRWLEKFKGEVFDIKVAGEYPNLLYLVLFENESGEEV